MNLTTILQPPFEPVSLADVYGALRLAPDHDGSPGEESHPDDALLTRHIATAREQVEEMARQSLVQRTLRLSMPGFPTSTAPSFPPSRTSAPTIIRLYRPPVLAVQSVTYFDASNALQTVDPSLYYFTDDRPPELRFVTGFSAPAVYDRPDAVRVTYVAGYAQEGSPAYTQAEYAANVPKSLKDAILVGVQMLYDNMSPADAKAAAEMQKCLIQPLKVHLSP